MQLAYSVIHVFASPTTSDMKFFFIDQAEVLQVVVIVVILKLGVRKIRIFIILP